MADIKEAVWQPACAGGNGGKGAAGNSPACGSVLINWFLTHVTTSAEFCTLKTSKTRARAHFSGFYTQALGKSPPCHPIQYFPLRKQQHFQLQQAAPAHAGAALCCPQPCRTAAIHRALIAVRAVRKMSPLRLPSALKWWEKMKTTVQLINCSYKLIFQHHKTDFLSKMDQASCVSKESLSASVTSLSVYD